MTRRGTLLFALVMTVGGCSTTSSSTSMGSRTGKVDAMQEGRRLTSAFYAGEASQIWDRLTAEMKKSVGAEGRLSKLKQQIEDQFGTEAVILDERTREFWHPNGSAVPSLAYHRSARFSKAN